MNITNEMRARVAKARGWFKSSDTYSEDSEIWKRFYKNASPEAHAEMGGIYDIIYGLPPYDTDATLNLELEIEAQLATWREGPFPWWGSQHAGAKTDVTARQPTQARFFAYIAWLDAQEIKS